MIWFEKEADKCNSDKKEKNVASLFINWMLYFLFGFIHELGHLFAHRFTQPSPAPMSLLETAQVFLGRACVIDTLSSTERQVLWIRHSGWITSMLVAVVVHWCCSRCSDRPSTSASTATPRTTTICSLYNSLPLIAWLTVLEGIVTDVFGTGQMLGCGTIFCCGNFGLILLNQNYQGETAFQMLQQMIQITMMRGAQSGGVLAWTANGSNNNGKSPLVAIRSRVVNGKRTDLSVGLRRKLQSDCRRKDCRLFLGHTRFATSSKATLDGTHPHQWTPKQRYRVYNMGGPITTSSSVNKHQPTAQDIQVENYITHNGDFDFFTLNGTTFGLSTIQNFLAAATGFPLPSPVDSVAIAGMMDLLRTQGCFGLSIRYALLLKCKSSTMELPLGASPNFPTYADYENLGNVFEESLSKFCQENNVGSLQKLQTSSTLRNNFIVEALQEIKEHFFMENKKKAIPPRLAARIRADLEQYDNTKTSLMELVTESVNAFLDNDLFFATRTFMSQAKGSFGLMVSSSLDADRQICLAARGQPMSIALYPKQGLVLYASELAAAKVALGKYADKTKGKAVHVVLCDTVEVESPLVVQKTCRMDLDDLGGEIVLIDWKSGPDHAQVKVTSHQESVSARSPLKTRVMSLEDNEYIRQLPTVDDKDPVLGDLRDIPKICSKIQSNWEEPTLNRFTAWNLVRRIKDRVNRRINGEIPTTGNHVDILLTGCETSLWLAEQFASDMRKAFPNLSIDAVSSNKLLGVFGQDLAMPAVGYPMSEHAPDLKGTVVIIVSHSGQTFAPLACSSLMQSFTEDIFLVTSEWDTQIGKQLRGINMSDRHDGKEFRNSIFSSRIFSTEVGVRPSEPCSVSVVALQQLLTQIFMYVVASLLGDANIRTYCRARISEIDLSILAKCNMDSIRSLESLVGTDRNRRSIKGGSLVEQELRSAGDVWSEHILEFPKAYIITFLYVLGTVTAGYPLITGVAIACGLETDWAFYICRFFDGLLYFFFHQLTVFGIRLFQGRNLRHRTTGRTVVIGDCPWVAQAADSFLSKLFAVSYPLAGLSVMHGNPADHLVHRHTHRVVRGTLLICGRPDGRLSALTNAEVSVCLSVNQASSIQNIGGTCESITIGHNPSELALTAKDIFLDRNRPLFLCEHVVEEMDIEKEKEAMLASSHNNDSMETLDVSGGSRRGSSRGSRSRTFDDNSSRGTISRLLRRSSMDDSARSLGSRRSAMEIKGLYSTLLHVAEEEEMDAGLAEGEMLHGGVDNVRMSFTTNGLEQEVIEHMLSERQGLTLMRRLFNELDTRGAGFVAVETFIDSYRMANGVLNEKELRRVVQELGAGKDGLLSFDDFCLVSHLPEVEVIRKLQISTPRNERGLVEIKPSQEEYFGKDLQRSSATKDVGVFSLSQSQNLAMELYESRIASTERFVAMCVMFHQMGSRVERFFRTWSFGFLGYRMDRTHSIMRVATTASPVSGADVRARIEALKVRNKIHNSLRVIESAWHKYQQKQVRKWKNENSSAKIDEEAPSRQDLARMRAVSGLSVAGNEPERSADNKHEEKKNPGDDAKTLRYRQRRPMHSTSIARPVRPPTRMPKQSSALSLSLANLLQADAASRRNTPGKPYARKVA